jgi:hypothetical protein
MKIVLEKEDIFKLVYNAISFGGLQELILCGVELYIDKEKLKLTNEKLQKKNTYGIKLSRYDLWLDIFMNEGLLFIDYENLDDITEYLLTPQLAYNNLK